MSVRMRHTKGHTANRRSHHALVAPRLSKCVSCEAVHLRHRVCDKCGKYKGAQILDVAKKVEKKTKKTETKSGAGLTKKKVVEKKSDTKKLPSPKKEK